MSDYISREAVVEFIRSYRCSTDVAIHMEQHLNEIPAADVRPVVCCCDCKHFQINISPSGYLPQGVPEWECRNWCRATDPTDFCSYGEKWEES